MTLALAPSLVVGSLLVCCGVAAAVWRRDRAGALTALPPLAAGVAVCFAAAGRFAAPHDPDTGQELAALVVVMALAGAILGAAWTRGSVAR